MSFHFPRVFPLICDRLVWHKAKHLTFFFDWSDRNGTVSFGHSDPFSILVLRFSVFSMCKMEDNVCPRNRYGLLTAELLALLVHPYAVTTGLQLLRKKSVLTGLKEDLFRIVVSPFFVAMFSKRNLYKKNNKHLRFSVTVCWQSVFFSKGHQDERFVIANSNGVERVKKKARQCSVAEWVPFSQNVSRHKPHGLFREKNRLLPVSSTREILGELEKAVETLACCSFAHSISRSPKLPFVFL